MDVAVRQLIVERASHRCEYCLIHEDSVGFPHQVDHVVSRKHGGGSELENLAYCCLLCNRYKGSDIASLDRMGELVRLFHPRQDSWEDHFYLDGAVIEPLSAVGETTTRILRLNAAERVVERSLLQMSGEYPTG